MYYIFYAAGTFNLNEDKDSVNSVGARPGFRAAGAGRLECECVILCECGVFMFAKRKGREGTRRFKRLEVMSFDFAGRSADLTGGVWRTTERQMEL